VQRTATYYKIREVLDTASTNSGGIDELADALHKNKSSFVYFTRAKDGNVSEEPVNENAIKRTIRFCIALKLLKSEEQSVLTEDGQTARETDRFDYQLQQSVLIYLDENHGLTWKRIKEAIDNLRKPHARALYQELAPENLGWDWFRTCFFLLSVCGVGSRQNILEPSQSKLYFVREENTKQ